MPFVSFTKLHTANKHLSCRGLRSVKANLKDTASKVALRMPSLHASFKQQQQRWRLGCLEELAEAGRQVVVVEVVLGQAEQQRVEGVGELPPRLLGPDLLQLLVAVHGGARREEVVEQHRDAHLQKHPVYQDLRRTLDESASESALRKNFDWRGRER